MKLSLLVAKGKAEGKIIPITVPLFFIGRASQCHLRPSNPSISKRHCVVSVQADKAYVRDLGSTNGTFVNDEQVTGEQELCHNDRLKVGPLLFVIRLEAGVAVNQATPLPYRVETLDDEAVADLWLAMQDEIVDKKGGTTISDRPRMSEPTVATPPCKTGKLADGDTSKAAEYILARMRQHRPRKE